MARYLIVANQTLGGEQLVARVDQLLAAGPATVHLAVPVTDVEGTHQWDHPRNDRAVPDAHEIARTLAEARLEHELARLHRLGIEADGQIVDADPVRRIREIVATDRFDEVVVSTLHQRLSRWLHTDLPHRLARALTVRVSHVEGSAGPSI